MLLKTFNTCSTPESMELVKDSVSLLKPPYLNANATEKIETKNCIA